MSEKEKFVQQWNMVLHVMSLYPAIAPLINRIVIGAEDAELICGWSEGSREKRLAFARNNRQATTWERKQLLACCDIEWHGKLHGVSITLKDMEDKPKTAETSGPVVFPETDPNVADDAAGFPKQPIVLGESVSV